MMDYKKEVYRLLESISNITIYKFLYDFLTIIQENW